MIHSSSNRATPTGENITKLVRQNYKPAPKQLYSHEKVQCRTEITCQKSKPEDYWSTNFKRRQRNMHRGFYSSSIEPYKPIGGQLILDPSELVMSALPGALDKKMNKRRRGTIFEEQKVETKPNGKEKNDFENDSFTSQDLIDTAPSAGYEDIKKLIKESKQRIISVKAGKWYEDHVKAVEENSRSELEASKPEDTGMVLKSVSSICLPAQTGKSSKQASSEPESRRSSRNSSGKVSIAEVITTPSPIRRDSGGSGRSTLRAPSVKKNKISLLQVSTGITSVLQRKERQFRDHLLYLKSMFNVLRALHNLKVRDIRSKVPLTREVVEKLQKEHFKEEDYSRGAYISHAQGRQRGGNTYRSGYSSRRTSIAEAPSELGDLLQEDVLPLKRNQIQQMNTKDYFLTPRQNAQQGRRLSVLSHNLGSFNPQRTSAAANTFGDPDDFMFDDAIQKKPTALQQRTRELSRGRGTQASTLQVAGDQGDGHHTINRMSIFNTAKRANTLDTATKNVFGRRQKNQKGRSTGEKSALRSFHSVARKVTVADQIFRNFGGNKSRRKSRNATNIATTDRSTLETWEDLLNVQPEPYKEEKGGANMCFQIGVITKFMRWYRKVEDASTERVKRRQDDCLTEREKLNVSVSPVSVNKSVRASIIPQHGALDKSQLSHLQEIHEKGTSTDRSEKEKEKGERESNYAPQRPGSAAQTTERVKKLPIWQQVAQEKSTVFQDINKAAPNPDTSVQRCKRNLNKLKRSVQKENTATLEKIVRERLANFRLKMSALNPEECSPLFEEQLTKLDDVKGNVNKCHLENFDVQPSKWYEELKEKTMNMISSYPQPEIIEALAKLQTYAHMDNKTLSFSKAKLCLLMMSLPAYDICQIYMQKALKFIFENIMLGQEPQFYEWLNHRKIPCMIISETNSRSESPFREFGSPTKDK